MAARVPLTPGPVPVPTSGCLPAGLRDIAAGSGAGSGAGAPGSSAGPRWVLPQRPPLAARLSASPRLAPLGLCCAVGGGAMRRPNVLLTGAGTGGTWAGIWGTRAGIWGHEEPFPPCPALASLCAKPPPPPLQVSPQEGLSGGRPAPHALTCFLGGILFFFFFCFRYAGCGEEHAGEGARLQDWADLHQRGGPGQRR